MGLMARFSQNITKGVESYHHITTTLTSGGMMSHRVKGIARANCTLGSLGCVHTKPPIQLRAAVVKHFSTTTIIIIHHVHLRSYVIVPIHLCVYFLTATILWQLDGPVHQDVDPAPVMVERTARMMHMVQKLEAIVVSIGGGFQQQIEHASVYCAG